VVSQDAGVQGRRHPPCNRVIVYYGNPASKKMGALGEFPRDEMLARLTRQVNQWKEADPNTPVVPACT
jgi:hypothetical protein